MSLLEKLQELVEAEVQKQLMKYAEVISKKHDISLKLLLRDIPSKFSVADEPVSDSSRCIGVTAKGIQCTFSAKYCGYCKRHVSQKKDRPKSLESPTEKSPHVGHTMKECLFLPGCPACEKLRNSRQNLLIDF